MNPLHREWAEGGMVPLRKRNSGEVPAVLSGGCDYIIPIGDLPGFDPSIERIFPGTGEPAEGIECPADGTECTLAVGGDLVVQAGLAGAQGATTPNEREG